jgi:hypothetical protein
MTRLVGGSVGGTASGVISVQGGASTANLQKGLTTANLATALANVPTAPAPLAVPAQSSAAPKAGSSS